MWEQCSQLAIRSRNKIISTTYKNQSIAYMTSTPSVGSPTAVRTISIVTSPASGTPAAPIAAAVAVTLNTQQKVFETLKCVMDYVKEHHRVLRTTLINQVMFWGFVHYPYLKESKMRVQNFCKFTSTSCLYFNLKDTAIF